LERSDSEIWKDFKSGEEEAFCILYDTYFSILCTCGRKFTLDEQLVKDCVQDQFVELISKREKLSDTDNVRFYLIRSLRRRIARRMNTAYMNFEQFLLNVPDKNTDPLHPGQLANYSRETIHKVMEIINASTSIDCVKSEQSIQICTGE
jgi:DNA-directed RNA polymerase specialized sigma24 family protein